MERVAWGILVGLNLMGAWNILTADSIFLERLGGNERLNPILFGMLAAMLAAQSLVRLLQPGNLLAVKLIHIATVLLGFFNLVASASKSPVLFFLTVLFGLMIFHSRKGNKKSLFLLLFILAGGVAAIFIYGLQDMLLLLLTRFTDITDDASSLERWEMLSGGFIQFLQEPFFGSFLEEKIWKEYPHNLVVEAFMATGIIGGTIFVLFYAFALRAAFKLLFVTGFSFISLSVLSVVILSMFSGGLSFSSDFWVVSAAGLGLMYQFDQAVAPNLKNSFGHPTTSVA